MSFHTYQEGLKRASVGVPYHTGITSLISKQDLATKAIQTEASLSSLSPLISALPTLQKAFPLYISSAESYSHLLSSNLVPETEKPTIKKKWRLVLERAEKVKNRIEELGGVVGKVGVGDEDEEGSILRRGGIINGVTTQLWREPGTADFALTKSGEVWRDVRQPVLATEQVDQDAVWTLVDEREWEVKSSTKERWLVRQGPGADCSFVAGLGVSMEHDKRWKTQVNPIPLVTEGQTDHII
jgi:calpain-7